MPEFLPNIKHFVYLMLENRSFDNLMGWLYEHEAPAHIIDGPTTHGQPFRGSSRAPTGTAFTTIRLPTTSSGEQRR
jgi:phospholipase C